MSRLVYVSFLGIGTYESVSYAWQGKQASKTPYAQVAELELLADAPDAVMIFGTPQSHAKHWEASGETSPLLKAQLETRGIDAEFVQISSDLSPEIQWQTFQKLLDRVYPGDELIIDMTHGFRAIPVVFSSALHFLRLAKDVSLRHVFYAAYEREKAPGAVHEIVDYVTFYAIQDWTDGVSRLVEDADARKLATLAQVDSPLHLLGPKGAELTEALQTLTEAVRNVEVNRVADRARAALELVVSSRGKTGDGSEPNGATAVLLKLVEDKFSALISTPPLTGRYERNYFTVQANLIALLIEHKLLMQAYTAMREYVGSLGMLGHEAETTSYRNSTGRKRRHQADVFLVMVAFEKADLRFKADRDIKAATRLEPYVEQLEGLGLIDELRPLLKELSQIRNGFDHAWTSKAKVPDGLEDKGHAFLVQLRRLTDRIFEMVEST